jgi:propionyl-CoA synthetase
VLSLINSQWSSESGSPISGIALSASAGLEYSSKDRPIPLAVKPGSAGKAMPGFDVRVVDDEGKEVHRGVMGNIVMGIPLAPTAFTTLWQDEERFYKGYLARFNGKWVDTGDAGMIDTEGYISIMSRADDVINVAAHRFSTGMSSSCPSMLTLTIRRRYRTSHHYSPIYCRSRGSGDTRRAQRPHALCLHHPLDARPP